MPLHRSQIDPLLAPFTGWQHVKNWFFNSVHHLHSSAWSNPDLSLSCICPQCTLRSLRSSQLGLPTTPRSSLTPKGDSTVLAKYTVFPEMSDWPQMIHLRNDFTFLSGTLSYVIHCTVLYILIYHDFSKIKLIHTYFQFLTTVNKANSAKAGLSCVFIFSLKSYLKKAN